MGCWIASCRHAVSSACESIERVLFSLLRVLIFVKDVTIRVKQPLHKDQPSAARVLNTLTRRDFRHLADFSDHRSLPAVAVAHQANSLQPIAPSPGGDIGRHA